MKSKTKTGLYWFRRDLRLSDNPTFNELCKQVDQLICVYVKGQGNAYKSAFCEASTSIQKDAFEHQSVAALDASLRKHQQYLLMLDAPSHSAIVSLVDEYDVTHIGIDDHPGVYEKMDVHSLENACPQVEFISTVGHTLFSIHDLPFELEQLPDTFTPFRKQVEKLPISAPIQQITKLPKSIKLVSTLPLLPSIQSQVQGGEEHGGEQLHRYLFGTHLIKQYKQTRNALDDWDSSSKLSFWLANGCLSAKTVFHNIKQYEARHGANESTYWLYFELLWREYFQWYLLKHKSRLFAFSGVKQIALPTQFNRQKFTQWCEGKTDYPIVNACMRQLNQTGYMSNRGRQLVASCLVHELSLDWRYGAAYFEQKLIDYDVASNWGNWQYLAGVGADPRGHRRFDLDKQTDTYDAGGLFRQKWLDSVDRADFCL